MDFAPAFGLHKFRPGRDQPSGIGHRLVRRLVTSERQVRPEQGARFRAGGGADMMLHLRHRHVRGVRIAEHDHAQRIADENQRNARLVEQLRHRKIIGRERGDLFAARFHGADGFGGDFGFKIMCIQLPRNLPGRSLANMFYSNHQLPYPSHPFYLWLKLPSNSSGVVVAVPILPTTMPAA